jgi:GNAT superfamily N-acetyltransferase
MASASHSSAPITVRKLEERNLAEADRIFRLAFGTFINLPDPMMFAADRDVIRTRWIADPSAVLAADVEGELAGSNFVARWGSVGFFGPLTIRPDLWGTGVAKRLLEATMDMFAQWQVTHAGLYTFAASVKHIALYQKFNFWPRFLTLNMARPVRAELAGHEYVGYSRVPAAAKNRAIEDCRRMAGEIYPGLDVSLEIHSVDAQRLGETVLLYDNSELAGFAVAHCGAGTEAGPGICYLKFAAIRPGAAAEKHFRALLDHCESFAASQGATKLSGGVNAARDKAYRSMLDQGFRTESQVLVIQRGDEVGYNRPDVYLMDDWR